VSEREGEGEGEKEGEREREREREGRRGTLVHSAFWQRLPPPWPMQNGVRPTCERRGRRGRGLG
jgi:hypothetical protein